MGDLIIPTKFEVSFYDIKKLNPLFSKGRVRILYTGVNRNGINLSKEVVEQMKTTLPYTPVVAEYSEAKDDFTDHATVKRTRPYGLVPENPNFTWETVEEENGVSHEYLTSDVLLWTGRYPEATKIFAEEKSHSMELDPNLIEGKWTKLNGRRVFDVTKAVFSALTALGDDVEPCFESAAFYSNKEDFVNEFNQMIAELKFSLKEGGNSQMKVNFKLSHEDIYSKIWNALNPLDENGDWNYNYSVSKVYDDYALVYDYSEQTYYRQMYAKGDNDTITIGDRIKTQIMDLTDSEVNALQAALDAEKANYAKLAADYKVLEEKVTNFDAINTELGTVKEQFTALQTNNETLKANFANAENEITTLKKDLTKFEAQAAEAELKAKEEMISRFTNALTEEEMKTVKENISNFTLNQIESELSVLAMRKVVNFQKDGDKIVTVFSAVGTDGGDAGKPGWQKLVEKHTNRK